MIKIGETHAVIPLILDGYREHEIHGGPGSFIATEAVKRQIDAHENLLIAIGMGWDLGGVIEQSKSALAPFTESDASLVDSGLRSCATPENDGSTPPKGADQ